MLGRRSPLIVSRLMKNGERRVPSGSHPKNRLSGNAVVRQAPTHRGRDRVGTHHERIIHVRPELVEGRD